MSRRTRRIPAWLRRLISERDAGFRFPGRARTRWTHANHVQHWAGGAPTDLDDLITPCGCHHRMLHNEGWELRGNPNESVEWTHPNGWTVQPACHHRDGRRQRIIACETSMRCLPRGATPR